MKKKNKSYEYTISTISYEEAFNYDIVNYRTSHKAAAFLVKHRMVRYKKKFIRGRSMVRIDFLGQLKLVNCPKELCFRFINIVDINEINNNRSGI